MTDHLRLLGKTAPPTIRADQLETVPIAPEVKWVAYTGEELSACCPVTGAPDLYDVEIGYRPEGVSLESKSLKLYLNGWRNAGIFAENLAAEIAHDLTAALARDVTVTLTQQPRGGLRLRAEAVGVAS